MLSAIIPMQVKAMGKGSNIPSIKMLLRMTIAPLPMRYGKLKNRETTSRQTQTRKLRMGFIAQGIVLLTIHSVKQQIHRIIAKLKVICSILKAAKVKYGKQTVINSD